MAVIDLLLEAVRLKGVKRAGWVRMGVQQPESVAAHSWGVSFLVLALLPPELDRERALTYAVLHDLPEVQVGDLTPEDGVAKAEKAAREHRAMARICAVHPRLREAWEAYEAQMDPEARFVRQLDRLDMAVQALAYAQDGARGMHAFLRSASAVVTHPTLRPLLDEIRAHMPEEP